MPQDLPHVANVGPDPSHVGQLAVASRVEDGYADSRFEKQAEHVSIEPTVHERIDHVTWAWFTLPMSTGGIALILSIQPHTFHGLLIIGRIVFVFNLVVWCTLVILISTRFVRNPGKFYASLSHPTESLFVPTYKLLHEPYVTGAEDCVVSGSP